MERELLKRPTVLIVSPEFLASTEVLTTAAIGIFLLTLQVRDVLMNCQLNPRGGQPVVAIDECQVLPQHDKSKRYHIIGFGRSFWMGRVSSQLWKLHLDLVDCCAGSKVGTKSLLHY